MPLLLTCTAAVIGVILGELLAVRREPLLVAAGVSAAGALLSGLVVHVRKPPTTRESHPAPQPQPQAPPQPYRVFRHLAVASALACAASLGAFRAACPAPLPLPTAAATTAAAPLRAALAHGLAEALPEPQAALATGILLGGSRNLEPALKEQLARTGLAHLLAIDGFKLVVVSTTLSMVAVPVLGRRRAAPLVLVVLAGYVLTTGAHPSAVRAALMATLATTAMLIGRLPDPLTSLLLVALAMLAIDPHLLGDLGFQLSFTATLSLILLYRSLHARARRIRPFGRRVPAVVLDPLVVTVVVTLGTLPIVLHVFARVSLISPLAHVVAVPLVAPIMLGAALVGTLTALHVPTQLVGWTVWLPTTALIDVTRAAAYAPGAILPTGRLPLGAAVTLGCVLLAWGIYWLPELRAIREKVASARRHHAATLKRVGTAGAAALATLGALIVRPDGTPHVTPFALRGGQAVFIRGPTGSTALVLSGQPSPSVLAGRIADQLAVWQPGLDLVVATDANAQTTARALTTYYPIGRVLLITTDARIDIGGGAMLDVFVPDETQRPSAALSYRDTATWLPLGATRGDQVRPDHFWSQTRISRFSMITMNMMTSSIPSLTTIA